MTWSRDLVNALSNAERELSRLATLSSNYPFPFPRILAQPFMRREAVLSSHSEVTRASLVDVYNYDSSQLSFLEEGIEASENLIQSGILRETTGDGRNRIFRADEIPGC
jgi:hypothetical protein